MVNVELRLAKLCDAKQIAEYSRDYIEFGLGWSWVPKRVIRSIKNPSVNVVVAEHDGELVGFGIMSYYDEHAHLDLLAVKPSYRRRGVGKGLLAWLEKVALTAGINIIYLECRAVKNATQKFYANLGYQKIKLLSGYYQGSESAVLMGRDLLTLSNLRVISRK